MSKIQISKQITTDVDYGRGVDNCIQYVKDTDFKANYNCGKCYLCRKKIVFNMSKIQISKQITTETTWCKFTAHCIQYVKDTDFKANYNQEI